MFGNKTIGCFVLEQRKTILQIVPMTGTIYKIVLCL